MKRSLILVFLLAFLIPAHLQAAAGDIKISQKNSTDTAWKDVVITPTSNSTLTFNSTLVPRAQGATGTGNYVLADSPTITGNTTMANLTVNSGSSVVPVDASLVVGRAVNNSVAGNGHGFTESSEISRTGTVSYAAYDVGTLISGSASYGHFAGYQSFPTFSTSGTITDYYGFHPGLHVTAGTVTNSFGLYASNPDGAGTVTNNYGVYIGTLNKGASKNYAIYTEGATPSWFGGIITSDAHMVIGAISASETVRKTLKLNNGGYADPAAAGSTSYGDKVVLQDPGSSYRNVIGFNGSGNMWFQSNTGIEVWNGATPTKTFSVISGAGTFAGSVTTASTAAFYIGDSATDGSWRFIRSGNNLVVERRESAAWVTKGTWTP